MHRLPLRHILCGCWRHQRCDVHRVCCRTVLVHSGGRGMHGLRHGLLYCVYRADSLFELLCGVLRCDDGPLSVCGLRPRLYRGCVRSHGVHVLRGGENCCHAWLAFVYELRCGHLRQLCGQHGVPLVPRGKVPVDHGLGGVHFLSVQYVQQLHWGHGLQRVRGCIFCHRWRCNLQRHVGLVCGDWGGADVRGSRRREQHARGRVRRSGRWQFGRVRRLCVGNHPHDGWPDAVCHGGMRTHACSLEWRWLIFWCVERRRRVRRTHCSGRLDYESRRCRWRRRGRFWCWWSRWGLDRRQRSRRIRLWR